MATSENEPPFGSRFALAWRSLQAYLADLDEDELAELEGADRGATLALLRRQPALGEAGALAGVKDGHPEEIAIRIVEEHLRALAPAASGPWGERFISAWRGLGAPLSVFKYSTLQEMKQSDRKGTIATLKGHVDLGYALLRRMDQASPEEAAQLLYAEAQKQQALAAALLLAWAF